MSATTLAAPIRVDTAGVHARPEAEPEVIARLAMANDVVLRRLAPAENAGLERLFFELTASNGTAPSPRAPAPSC